MAIGTTVTVGFNSTAVQSGFRKISRGFKTMTRGFANAGRAMLAPFIKLMALMAPIIGVGALAMFTKGAIQSAAEFEDMALRMEQFTGSATEATKLLNEMTKFSLATPFETKDLQEAAAAFLGAGIKEGVGDLVKDVAAVAKNGQQIMELTDALAKGFAKGKFQTEEINKFLERGINLLPELRKATGLQGTEFQKAVEKGLKFEDVTKALSNLSREGGLFFGMLQKQSKTTGGLFSTLMSGFEEMKKAFGTPINNIIKPILADAIGMVDGLIPKMEKLGQTVGNAIKTLYGAFKADILGDLLWESFKFAGAKLGQLLSSVLEYAVQQAIEQMAEAGVPGIKSANEAELVGTGRNVGGVLVPTGFKYKDPKGVKSFGEIMESNSSMFGGKETKESVKALSEAAQAMSKVPWLKQSGWTDPMIARYLKDIAAAVKNNNPQFAR